MIEPMPAETTIPTRIVVNGEEMTLEAAPRFTCIVHQQGIRVDIPEFVEINGRKTLDCMEKMSQRAWVHISTGDLFKILFRELFPEEEDGGRHQTVLIPETIEQLNKGDFGVIHGAGMIVLGCEAIFEGNTKIFFRTPEDHMHPKTERHIVAMFMKMQQLLTPEPSGIATAVQGLLVPPEPEKKPKKARKKKDK